MQANQIKEFSFFSVFLGIILSIVMGAANVYLGLKVGMTVSASIPAAVIALGILRGVFRRKSILEANLVQTSASAGESLAAGVIFTMPALILIGIWTEFDFWTTTLVSMTGGLLGILFMIPMRKVFVVESTELKYPEGVACAEILTASEDDDEDSTSNLKMLFTAVGIGGVFEFGKKFFHIISSTVEGAAVFGKKLFCFGFDVSPALIGVGYIVGLSVAMQVFLGGCIGWLIAIPVISNVDPTQMDGSAIDMAYGLWSTKIRYIGVGAMIIGGIASIFKVRHSMVGAVKELFAQMSNLSGSDNLPETERNIPGKAIVGLTVATLLTVAATYYQLLNHDIKITVLTTIIIFVASFFFTAVASYIVGLVGNSNSPVSGMTITAVLMTGLLLYIFGFTGTQGIVAVLVVAGVICCVCCTAGDVCNDLKTGQLVGASPRKQQWMQIIGVVVASFVMAPVLTAIHEGSINAGTGGIGGKDLPAPQAGLFASLAEGFFGDVALPWEYIAAGAAIAVLILIVNMALEANESEIKLYVMPVAVGIYLPVGISVPIMIGGVMHYLISKAGNNNKNGLKKGTLISSGLIAGESLMGVILAIFAYKSITGPAWEVSEAITAVLGTLVTVGVAYWIYQASRNKTQ